GMAMNRPTEDRLMRMAPAAAPSAQSGAGAVAAARSSSAMMGAGNLASADAAAEQAMGDAMSGSIGRRERVDSRRIAGKLFIRRDSVWTDAAHQASLRVIE